MRLRKRTILRIFIFFIPDIVFSVFIIYILSLVHGSNYLPVAMGLILFFIIFRSILYLIISWNYYTKRVTVINEILSDFKKGRFILSPKELKDDNELSDAYNELRILGKHLDSMIAAQKAEIDKFMELYNNIIYSISSYFLIIDETEHIIYANDGFCKKFEYQSGDITGKRIDEIFYFINARLREGIVFARKKEKTIFLEKTHLLSINKISIIADIKISYFMVQGESQILMIIDDVTNKLRKDYQISLMSQISESIQRDVKIERVLYTMLTGVTSGSGLGFNRAMLFLVSDSGEYLKGEMAVGPDSFEEAIDIWSNIHNFDITAEAGQNNSDHGSILLGKVQNARFPLDTNNIFIRCLKSREKINIKDMWNDPSIGPEIRELMDVKEFVIVPLVVGNSSIGLLIVDNKFNQAPIGGESIELLATFATQAALSIESHKNLESVKYEMDKISKRQEAIIESEKMAAVGRIAAHIAHESMNPLVTMGGYARRISQLTR